ncbi:MAG TPA: cupin domain-containing protein [Pyrinomonadaceae bacterium]|jgi:ribosomal protein L16 Arg81 hydroxylase
MRGDKFDLEFLLAPTSVAEFFSRHWERVPLFVARREPERYASLLVASELDDIISNAFAQQKSSVEALGEDDETRRLEAREAQHVAEIYEAYRRGATIRVNRAQRYRKSLREMCAGLEQLFGFPVRVNLYCSPASAQPSPRHYDNHDVLVLQLSGRKHWRVYNPVVSLPLANVPPLPFEERTEMLKYARGGPKKGRADIDNAEAGAPTHELTLESGDLLYLPRGFVHEAWTSDATSAHLTVGLHVLTWLDLLTVALAQVSNRDERFRKSLPINFDGETESTASLKEQFDELLQAFARQADARRAMNELVTSFIRNTQTIGEGALASAADATDIDLDTPLERRTGVLCRFISEGEMVGLVSSQNILWMPKSFAQALRFAARTRRFRPTDIPGQLSDNSKLILARRLIQDGLLKIVE